MADQWRDENAAGVSSCRCAEGAEAESIQEVGSCDLYGTGGDGPVESGLIRLPEPVTHTIQPAPVDQPTCIQSIQSNLSH